MKAFLFITITAISILFSACTGSQNNTSTGTDSTSVKTAGLTYTCPMHPEVISDKPGKCPKCNMDLVEKKPESMTDSADHTGHQH